MDLDTDIVNIKGASQRAAELGIPLSEYTLRRAIRSGKIPCRIIGHTYLIPWKNVLQWLNCEDGGDSYQQSTKSGYFNH